MATPGLSTPNRTTRKRRPMNVSPALNLSTSLLEVNDDIEERRLRRKSKLLTGNILSPGGVQASPSRPGQNDKDKRKSISLSHAGVTNAQLKEHYANCIKLSSENKINVKNAFGLHLIDYMKDLLKESNKDENATNFQVASCTLDAGVKIYAYRVDSVHSEAYKVLGSLGRAVNNPDEPEDGEQPDSQEGGSSQPVAKKTKKRAAGKTIETNMKNINCEQLDIDYEVDPFFTKISAACDEAGTTSLLSFHLRSHSDLNDLLLDSSTTVDSIPNATVGETTNDDDMVDLSSLRDMYNNLPLTKMEICPQFSNFNFTGWDKDSQDIGGNIHLPDDSFDGDNIHRFDENAPVVSEAMESFDTGGCGGMDDFSDNDERNDALDDLQFGHQGAAIPDNGMSSKDQMFGTTGTSHIALSLNPSEYSYFSQDHMKMWAGPLHWKVKAKSKDKTISTTNASKMSTKKTQIRIDFDEEIDLKKHFTTGRGATHMKAVAMDNKQAAQMSVLPADLHYETESLFKLSTRTFVSIKRQSDAVDLKNEGDEWYNYDNKNDREGFCPALDDYGDDNYDDDDGGGCGADITLDEGGLNNDDQQITTFGGAGLVAPPNKVRVLDINYAKAAKRIDIKKLKGTMWKMLTAKKENDKENKENNNLPKPDIQETESEKDQPKDVSGSYTFKSMYDALPNKVSSNMSKNLSAPIAFVCLLYLANEKNLKLTGCEDMANIKIESGP